jgi:HEAT repeat protein
MKLRFRSLTAALLLALGFAPLLASAAPQAQEGAPLAEPSKSLYWDGHEALGRSDWDEAFRRFRELESELSGSKTESTDAAVYWQAYALVQAQRWREANALVRRVQREFPKSAWRDDAEGLAARITAALDAERAQRRQDKGEERAPAHAEDPREADALMALDALLSGGNQKAVPLLQKVLAGDHSNRVKSRAIFVLGQIDPSAAEVAIETLLAGDAPVRLKAEAIRMVAAGGRRESLDRMLPVYQKHTDAVIRRGVLDAFLIGDRDDLILKLLQTETDPHRRRDAIQKLGAMGKGGELQKLYATLPDARDRRAVLQALGVAGAQAALIQIARSETDDAVRAEAIRAVGISGGKEAPAALKEFYVASQAGAVREAVIDALMIADETEVLVELYRAETDPALRRHLLNRITASDSDAALELIDQALDR